MGARAAVETSAFGRAQVLTRWTTLELRLDDLLCAIRPNLDYTFIICLSDPSHSKNVLARRY
jgi:hypothetical protein